MNHTDVTTAASPWQAFCAARDAYLDAADRRSRTSRDYADLRRAYRRHGTTDRSRQIVNAARARRDRARQALIKARETYRAAWATYRREVRA